MKIKLTEIVKGVSKGFIGNLCSFSIMGLPAADGIYKTIETKAGKISYAVTGAAMLTTIASALYSLGN